MVFIPAEDGRWVDENFERLARIIQDYDEFLELRWIPPEKRTRKDKKPYAIVDVKTNTVVFFASELDTPVDILERLFLGDTTKHDVLAKLEAREAAEQVMEYKKYMDAMEEAKEEALFMLQTPLNTVRINGKKFDHNRKVIGPSVDRKVI